MRARGLNEGFYFFYSNLLKNDPKIGRRPIKGDSVFFIQIC
jgi:hypothetical protein